MCMCIYIYMCMCIYIYVSLSLYIYIYIYTHTVHRLNDWVQKYKKQLQIGLHPNLKPLQYTNIGLYDCTCHILS